MKGCFFSFTDKSQCRSFAYGYSRAKFKGDVVVKIRIIRNQILDFMMQTMFQGHPQALSHLREVCDVMKVESQMCRC